MIDQKRPVLIVTYDWSPSASVGVVRPTKLAKYLAKNGWRPIVLTVKESGYEKIVRGAPETVPSSHVLRTKYLPNPKVGYMYLKKFVTIVLRLNCQNKVGTNDRFAMRKDSNKVPSLLFGLKAILLSIFHIPDEFQGWLPFAVAATVRAVRRHKIKHVITSGPPFTAHLIGWSAKILFGRRLTWIVDFRDPWAGNEQRPDLTTSPLSEWLNGFLERQVIKHANHVVCVTPAMTESYRKRYPRVTEEKWHTITNGFEREEFEKADCTSPNGKFTISYVGSLEYERSPELLLRVLGTLCQEGIINKANVSVRLIGKCRTVGNRQTSEMIRDVQLEDVVELIDAIPRQQALKEMIQSNVLLLLATAQRLQVPGKAYEYLAAGRFVLAITEAEGATADLLKRVGGTALVPPNDFDVMRRVLIEQYDHFLHQNTAVCIRRTDVLAPYEWSKLGAQYTGLLERVDLTLGDEMAHLEKGKFTCPG